ncbi:MAG: IclR family transcriptional regulator [Spirochaetia bacterium]|jgi:DNA-binding IclR family transcriptional regulator
MKSPDTLAARHGSAYIIPNLNRALRVLELLSAKETGASITEISKELGLPKNSVFRIVRTLAANGYLDEHGKSYRLSPKILSLGYAAVQSTHLISACLDEMRSLRDEINETIFVGALSEGRVVILEQLPSFQLVKFTIEIGHKVPIHASAPGKVILSFLPPAEQKDLLAHIAFTRFNDRTIPSMKAMMQEIEKVQGTGYALDQGEEVSEIWCAASPVFDYREYPIASLWLSGPEFRVSHMDLDKVGTLVREHALRVSKQFGYDASVSRYPALRPAD